MSDLLTNMLNGVLISLLSLFIPLFAGLGVILYTKVNRYKKSRYYAQTGYSYFKVVQDTGLYGEYLCVAAIEERVRNPFILTNVYLPHPTKKDRTTEVDVLFIDQSGVHVIESKNYSGWIFGRAQDQKWTQSLPNRKKFKFFNPIKQNELHMKAVEQVLDLDRSQLFSWIVFSDRSTLKKVDASDVPVLNRKAWKKQIMMPSEARLTSAEQIALYERLLPYMNVSEDIKAAHIAAIKQAT
ncbi:nuclease-related domain protein [Exiguobacterium sp. S17]|nr:nuclease-related domain protein [Exiguobacterium sp. S17]